MKSTPKAPQKESDDALANVVMDMLSRGEQRRVLAGYTVSIRLEVEPRIVAKPELKQ
jgi:hypothetical protein